MDHFSRFHKTTEFHIIALSTFGSKFLRVSGNTQFRMFFYTMINPLMHNVLKWSDTLQKSCSKIYKVFKVCLTTLGHYALKGNLFHATDFFLYPLKTSENQ